MEQATAEIQTFQNENVRFSVHRKPECVVEYDVEALEPLASSARQKAIKSVAKQVTLPGFRKGKAPDSLIAKNYPKEIDKEWQQEMGNLAFQECQKLAKIPVLHRESRISFNMKSHSPSGALLTLSFETEPSIPKVDPKEMKLKSVKRPLVNDEKIDETIRQVQLFFASWQHVADRPVQEGDYVLLDVNVTEEEPAVPLFSETRFEVKERSMAKWMYDLVLGRNIGESIDGISTPDAEASEEDKAELKPKKVRVTIRSIDTATLPELNDEFVVKLGVASVSEMREKVTTLLNHQADAHVREAEREQVSNFLLQHYPFDIPRALIEKETHYRFQQLGQDTEFRKYWEQLSNEEKRKTVATIQEQSEKAVRMFYLCRHIVSDANIRISTSDVPPPASSALEILMNPQKTFHHQRNPEVEHAEAFSRLVLEKAEDHIIENAVRE